MTIRPRPGLKREFADCMPTNSVCKKELEAVRNLATAMIMSAIRDYANPNRMSFQHWLKDEKQPMEADTFLLNENAAGFWLEVLEINHADVRPTLERLLEDSENLRELLKGGATKFRELEGS